LRSSPACDGCLYGSTPWSATNVTGILRSFQHRS